MRRVLQQTASVAALLVEGAISRTLFDAKKGLVCGASLQCIVEQHFSAAMPSAFEEISLFTTYGELGADGGNALVNFEPIVEESWQVVYNVEPYTCCSIQVEAGTNWPAEGRQGRLCHQNDLYWAFVHRPFSMKGMSDDSVRDFFDRQRTIEDAWMGTQGPIRRCEAAFKSDTTDVNAPTATMSAAEVTETSTAFGGTDFVRATGDGNSITTHIDSEDDDLNNSTGQNAGTTNDTDNDADDDADNDADNDPDNDPDNDFSVDDSNEYLSMTFMVIISVAGVFMLTGIGGVGFLLRNKRMRIEDKLDITSHEDTHDTKRTRIFVDEYQQDIDANATVPMVEMPCRDKEAKLNEDIKGTILKNDIEELTRITSEDNFDESQWNGVDGTNGYTMLHFAVREESLKMVDLILSHDGVNVNARCAKGDTPLMLASCGTDDLVLKALLDKGADQRITNEMHSPPLSTAIKYGNKRIINALLEPLLKFELSGKNGKFAKIRSRALLGDCDMHGRNVLHWYVSTAGDASLETLRTIMRIGGSDPKFVNCPEETHGLSPLMLATKEGNMELMEALLLHGASLTHTDHYGRTAYDYVTDNMSRTVLDSFNRATPPISTSPEGSMKPKRAVFKMDSPNDDSDTSSPKPAAFKMDSQNSDGSPAESTFFKMDSPNDYSDTSSPKPAAFKMDVQNSDGSPAESTFFKMDSPNDYSDTSSPKPAAFKMDSQNSDGSESTFFKMDSPNDYSDTLSPKPAAFKMDSQNSDGSPAESTFFKMDSPNDYSDTSLPKPEVFEMEPHDYSDCVSPNVLVLSGFSELIDTNFSYADKLKAEDKVGS